MTIVSCQLLATSAVVVTAMDMDFTPSTFLRGLPSLLEGSSPWGASVDNENGNGNKRMKELRRLLQSSSDAAPNININNNNDNSGDNDHDIHKNNRTASSSSSSWSSWHTQWSMLSESDLGAIAYDASSLTNEAHRAWGAAYLGGRRTRTTTMTGGEQQQQRVTPTFENIIENEEVDDAAAAAAAASDDDLGITSFLRGAFNGNIINNENNNDNNNNENGNEGKESQQRHLASWTKHGDDANDPLGGLSFTNIEQQTTATSSATGENEETAEEEERQALRQRLSEVLEASKALEELHVVYDTNEEYTYSDPPNINNNNNNNNNSDSNNTNDQDNNDQDTMQQFSHTAALSRQRLLTGSYAAWQWYDRDALATPMNLKLTKVSRVNYAFFQTDGDGYIFGTDSWADPNVLFGPYEFATSSDKLDEACKGGLGRDDGKFGGVFVEMLEEEEGDGGNVTDVEGEFSTDPSDVTGDDMSEEDFFADAEDGIDVVIDGNSTSTTSRFRRRRRRGLQTTSTTTDDSNNSNNNSNNKARNPGQTGPPEEACEYFEQCHRNFPNSKSCNIHKYKEGLIYRSHISGAQIYPSIGGWTLSGSFPDVAASAIKRKRFAKECVGLIADYGFDGIDIDWQYPGYEPHGGTKNDAENFNKLLLEVRSALTEYEYATGNRALGGGSFGLTAALPCGPANIEFLDVEFLSQVLNGMNLMTFDFHGADEPRTGVNSPLYDQTWDTEDGLSVDGCVKNYYEGGAGGYASKISIGVPFYGKTFSFATELNDFHSNTNGRGGGMVDQDNWPQEFGTPVYYNILDNLRKGGMISKRHELSFTQYAYFKDESGLVTYDDPQAVCDKANYVNTNLLGGLFVWEMSGDLMGTLETPLLDAINRKLEESNFDCRLIASPEDGAVITLPPPAPKGPTQIERRDDESIKEAILIHLTRAENGELVSGGGAKGAFTRAAFMYRTWDGGLFPSYVYRFPHFLDALKTMSTEGVDGDLFYLGYGQDGQDDAAARRQRQLDEEQSSYQSKRQRQQRSLQASFGIVEAGLGPTEVSKRSLVYGLVNIAAFLAQAMSDSIIHDSCDELNIDHLPLSSTDGIGLDDGNDMHRFPSSNACGQNGRSYEDEICEPADRKYDCVEQLNIDEQAAMVAYGTSRGHWGGAPGPFYCGPTDMYPETGFWDAMVGREVTGVSAENREGRIDVQGCCWWGRGSLSIKGTCLYGKLNYHIGKKKAEREGIESALFPDVDFCNDPGQICTGLHSIPLRWISGMYHWMEKVQKYNKEGYKYKDELVRYVNEDLSSEEFFEKVTNIHLLDCHNATATCPSRSVDDKGDLLKIDDMGDRLRNFEKVLSLFGLQFGSHADPEPPFQVFPGQQRPTPSPTIYVNATEEEEIITPSPTLSPVALLETEVVPVNVFLTGVPDGLNMTNNEQDTFERLMKDLLDFRLAMVNIIVDEVKIKSQMPNPEFSPQIISSSEGGGGGGAADEEAKPVLQLVMDVTIMYSPPTPPEIRGWSIYIKSWIESFGNTMVEIFTKPKHIQHPETSSKFWDDLIDVSATNIDPPNTDPTTMPTQSPTFFIYPDTSKNTYIYAGIGAVAGLGLCLCCAFFCFKLRQYRQLQANLQNKVVEQLRAQEENDDEERRLHMGQTTQLGQLSLHQPLDVVSEEETTSSSDSSSSSSSEDSSDESNSSEEEEESQYTEEDGTKSRSTYAASIYSEDEERTAPESATSRSAYEEEESFSTYEGSESASTYRDESVSTHDTSLKSKTASTGKHSSYNSSYVTIDEESEEESEEESDEESDEESEVASRAGDYNTDGSDDDDDFQGREEQLDQEEMELEQFDEIVERVLANDPTLKQVVLDNREEITGKRHEIEALWNALVSNRHVERLSMRSSNITDEEAASLSLALMDNNTVTHIWLGDNAITSEGVEYLIATLESNQTIVYLELAGNVDIDPDLEDEVKSMLEPREVLHWSGAQLDEVAALIERVQENDPTLTVLDLHGMDIGARDDALSLFDALAENTYIKKVDLSSNEIDDDCLSPISLSLLENTSISHLNLANNEIYSEGVEYLIGTLNENQTLEDINLEGNHCDSHVLEEIDSLLNKRGGSLSEASDESAKLEATIRSLTANDPNLVELRLDGIDLVHNPEAEQVIDALSNNTFVTTLSFDNTDMDDTLVAALSLALGDNQTVTHLSLRDNQITNEGCEYLLGTLDSNTTVAYLDLSGNFVDEDLMNEIDAIVSQRQSQVGSLSLLLQRVKSNDPTLTELVLDNRPDVINSYEFEAILEAVAHNSIVAKLSLCNTGFDDSLAAALSLALVDNTSITEILLSDNEITNDGCEYILGTLDSNTSVACIDLNGNLIDEHLMDEIDAISSSRTAKSKRVERNVDLGKPPMHEVPEESDMELAKREAIMAVMRDTSIPWTEKNKQILEIQQKYFVPKDGNEEPAQPQAATGIAEDNIANLIDRVMDNDRKLVKVELDGQDLNREDEAALFDALAQNSCVASLSLVNCRIANDGAGKLCDVLRENSTLTHINLEDNQITSNAAKDLISVLKDNNDTVQYLELKDNQVRSGLLSQMNKILEKRRPGFVEPMVTAAASYLDAQAAPVTASPTVSHDVESRSSNRNSGSRSSKPGKSKSRRRGDRHKSKSNRE